MLAMIADIPARKYSAVQMLNACSSIMKPNVYAGPASLAPQPVSMAVRTLMSVLRTHAGRRPCVEMNLVATFVSVQRDSSPRTLVLKLRTRPAANLLPPLAVVLYNPALQGNNVCRTLRVKMYAFACWDSRGIRRQDAVGILMNALKPGRNHPVVSTRFVKTCQEATNANVPQAITAIHSLCVKNATAWNANVSHLTKWLTEPVSLATAHHKPPVSRELSVFPSPVASAIAPALQALPQIKMAPARMLMNALEVVVLVVLVRNVSTSLALTLVNAL